MLDAIRPKVRNIINENTKTGTDVFTYDSSDIFKLGEDNVQSVSALFVNDVEYSESGNWSYSSSTNRLTLESGISVSSGDTIEVEFTYYPNYSDAEINNYIKAALYHISVNRYKTFQMLNDLITPEPTEEEQNLIAVVTSVLIKPDNKSYRLPDITINMPSNSMPTGKMAERIIASFKRNSHGIMDIL